MRPHLAARALQVALLLLLLLAGVATARSGYEGFSVAFSVLAFGVTLALGAGVRVAPGDLLVRNWVTERTIARERIVGLAFGTTLDIVVRGGRRHMTMLVQTNFAPTAQRMDQFCVSLAAPGDPPLPVVSLEELGAMGGPGSPDFAPDVMRSERAHGYWPAPWQWVVIALWLASLALLVAT